MEILLTLHGWVRWLVLAAAVGGAALALFRPGSRPGRIFALAFVGLLDLQLLGGVAIYLIDAENRGAATLHLTTMAAAVTLAHVFRARQKKRPDVGPRRAAAAFLVPLAFILLGLWMLE